jgi:hypothetical protein
MGIEEVFGIVFDPDDYPDCPEKTKVIETFLKFREELNTRFTSLIVVLRKKQKTCDCPEDKREQAPHPTMRGFLCSDKKRCTLCHKEFPQTNL